MVLLTFCGAYSVDEQLYSNAMIEISQDGSTYSGYGVYRGGWNEGEDAPFRYACPAHGMVASMYHSRAFSFVVRIPGLLLIHTRTRLHNLLLHTVRNRSSYRATFLWTIY